jgi:hypothetical protein
MKKHFALPGMIALLLLFTWEKCPAKNVILFIMESDAYNALGGDQGTINSIRTSIQDWEDKICPPVIRWTYPVCNTHPCTNYDECNPLFIELQNQYRNIRNSGNVLEGVILIGRIPIPLYTPDARQPRIPFDKLYMDLANGAGATYADLGLESPFPFDAANDVYTTAYQNPPGDGIYDIWVSRIDAFDLGDIREKDISYTEYQVYQRYFDRWNQRMNFSAKVPSRGFVMGGCQDLGGNIHAEIGAAMDILNMKWTAEFATSHSSTFNWASQLLAGPRGCITNGAFNHTDFPNTLGKNRRFCRYNNLPEVYLPTGTHGSQAVSSGDSLGWEWAGVFNHSFATGTNFWDAYEVGPPLQGSFGYGTYGPFWGGSNDVRGPAQMGDCYGNSCHVYNDAANQSDIYNYLTGWKGKSASWRWIVPTGGTGDYRIYVHYDAPVDPGRKATNCNSVTYRIMESQMQTGVAVNHLISDNSVTVNQQTHINPSSGDANLEVLLNTLHLTAGNMFIIEINLNDGLGGDHVVDAVAVRLLPAGTTVYIDDTEPTFTEPFDNPGLIFSTAAFTPIDYINRSYEDLGDENGGNGRIKTPFYCHNACNINEFNVNSKRALAIDKNIGTLLALGHEGLICMGAVSHDNPGVVKNAFFECLASGLDFGEAFRAQMQAQSAVNADRVYGLLGAGALRWKPYVQFNSLEIRDRTFNSGTNSFTPNQPIYLYHVTVNGTAGLVATSTHNTSSPFGTYSEVKMRESTLSPTGSNEVRLNAAGVGIM